LKKCFYIGEKRKGRIMKKPLLILVFLGIFLVSCNVSPKVVFTATPEPTNTPILPTVAPTPLPSPTELLCTNKGVKELLEMFSDAGDMNGEIYKIVDTAKNKADLEPLLQMSDDLTFMHKYAGEIEISPCAKDFKDAIVQSFFLESSLASETYKGVLQGDLTTATQYVNAYKESLGLIYSESQLLADKLHVDIKSLGD
jgi:hypothetical protein